MKPIFPAVALLLLLTACDDRPAVSYQGYMETEPLLVGPDEAGRLVSLSVEEGATVAAGAPLFMLDAALQRAQLGEAAARLAETRARLANLMAQQQRPEEIEVLVARRRQADAALDLARQDLRRNRELFDRGVSAKARLDQAEAAFRESQAQLQQVEQQIQAGRLTARVQEIAAAGAMIDAAEAVVAQAREKLDRRSVSAPAAGIVQNVLYRPGEVVATGHPVISLLPPERLRARFFVPEPRLSQIRIGQTVELQCDGCGPGLRARVSFVSREVEFTPPVIFGPTERAKLVFMAEAIPEGPAGSLLTGQPVSVVPLSEGVPR